MRANSQTGVIELPDGRTLVYQGKVELDPLFIPVSELVALEHEPPTPTARGRLELRSVRHSLDLKYLSPECKNFEALVNLLYRLRPDLRAVEKPSLWRRILGG